MPRSPERDQTLVEITHRRAMLEPSKIAFTYLKYRPQYDESHLTIGELDRAARSMAAILQARVGKGGRVLLLYRPGLEFPCAFLACLYAGVIATPAVVPRFGQGVTRLKKIARDADTRWVLSTTTVMKAVTPLLANEMDLEWILSDVPQAASPEAWTGPCVEPGDIALLQYSSGSTGDPKGVMISHGNLMHQSELFRGASGGRSDSCCVSWLPLFHDLGLIAGIVQPLYVGHRSVLMAPEAFVERPVRWLKAICDHRAELSFAPNFAYDLCVRVVTDEERLPLDLSCWRFALNGAEPIRARTIEQFEQRFSAQGFKAQTAFPAYGLAEATLVVTGGSSRGVPTIRSFDAQALDENRAMLVESSSPRARALVSSGLPLAGQRVCIVDPTTQRECAGLQIGEVWVAGGSMGVGFWGRPEETRQTFHAQIAGFAGQSFLRTGDLGFFCEDELFLCGRLKDLILIRGRNLHAPDIEQTVELAHPALRPSCGAAFSVDVDSEERLIVAHELDRQYNSLSADDLMGIVANIRQAIIEQHEVFPHAIVLLVHGTIPKTSSGKIQRRESKTRYLAGTLKTQLLWTAPAGGTDKQPAHEPAISQETPAAAPGAVEVIERWFVAQLISHGVQPGLIDPERPFERFALQPGEALSIISAAQLEYQRPLSLTLFSEFSCIRELARYLANRGIEKQSSAMPADEQVMTHAATAGEPIAIVGIGCRFPGGDGPAAFWKMLCDGADAVTEVPPERWEIDEVYDANPLAAGKMNTRCGGFLSNIDRFDRQFFSLSIREAVRMDPQHRLMMEVAWEALEDAGIVAADLAGTNTGVFVGISGSDYAQMQFGDPLMSDAYAGLGSALTLAASRVAYFLDLQGPAIAVDTACSSSLSALHLACVSLRRGECTAALAGGVNILLSPVVTMCLTKAGMMSPDGRCKAFDSRANGYVRAEGAGVVLLKPLSKALAEGDLVYAVIRGTASNQDGRSSGIAAPNGDAQRRVILAACREAGISPGDIDYIEAHGTGTSVGDPIEARAIGEVVASGRPADSPCGIGSVKTNIGHAESAAGIASIIKAALILEHRLIPPTLHFEQPNPLIPFDTLPLYVNVALKPLPTRERPALIGVNGFGVGGTNVHVILEEAPRSTATSSVVEKADDDRPHLVPLSARSAEALKGIARSMAEILRRTEGERQLANITFTAALCRSHLQHRLAVVGRTAAELADALDGYLGTGFHAAAFAGKAPLSDGPSPKLVFMFTGQGSQWWAMGRQLFNKEPVYRRMIERCDQLILPHTGWSLIEALSATEGESRVQETRYAQPAIFSLQVALSALWESWGIRPDAVVGHSVGEVAAACVAGALSLEDAVLLIVHRADLMQQATGRGRMANVELPHREVEEWLVPFGSRLTVAAINSPTSTVVSGDAAALEELLQVLRVREVVCVPLPVNYAFHSAQMEPFKHQLAAVVGSIVPRPVTIPMMSTVTADWCGTELLDARYWGDNIREPVRFADAIAKIAQGGACRFLEIGPTPVLSGMAARTLKSMGRSDPIMASLRRDADDQQTMLSAFAALYAAGADMAWRSLVPRGERSRALPNYVWDRQRFWLDANKKKKPRRTVQHPLLTTRLPVAHPGWQSELECLSHPFLKVLRVGDRSQLSNGVLIEMAIAAACFEGDTKVPELLDVHFPGVSELAHDVEAVRLQAILVDNPEGGRTVGVYVQAREAADAEETWTLAATARTGGKAESSRCPMTLAVEFLRAECLQELQSQQLYTNLREIGLSYDSAAQLAQTAWRGDAVTLLQVRLPETAAAGMAGYVLHPLMFEAAEQAIRIALGTNASRVRLERIQRVRAFRPWAEVEYVYARLRDEVGSARSGIYADAWMITAAGDIVAHVEGAVSSLHVRSNDQSFAIPADPREWLYDIEWQSALQQSAQASTASANGSWLIFADRGGRGSDIARWLRAKGQQCVVVRHGKHFSRDSDGAFTVATGATASTVEDIRRIIVEAQAVSQLAGIVHCWSFDSAPSHLTTPDSIIGDQLLGAAAVVYTIQAITAAEPPRPPRLWVFTAATQSVEDSQPVVALSAASIWGLGKAIAIEHPELRCCRIDLSATSSPEELEAACEEIWADSPEDQVALRGPKRYVARLTRHTRELEGMASVATEAAPQTSIPESGTYRIAAADHSGGNLVAISERAGAPGPDEVEIEVWLAHTEQTGSLACDHYVGRVVRVGLGAVGFRTGDVVVALCEGGALSHVTVATHRVARLPASMAERGRVPPLRPFLTALCALREVGAVAAGARVTIHGCDSPVGRAALLVARWLGAHIIATASTASGREWALSQDVEQVLDANSLATFGLIRKLANGRGTDVFLNCVADFDPALGAPILSAFGKYIDVARGGAGSRSASVRSVLPKNIAFHSVDVDALLRECSEQGRQWMQEVLEMLAGGTFPWPAIQQIDVASLLQSDAASALAQRVNGEAAEFVFPARNLVAPDQALLRSDVTYLVTGGLGALGLHIGLRMVQRGARNLVLVGRRPPTAQGNVLIAEMRQFGAQVRVMTGDIGDADDVKGILEQIQACMPPLRGIIHAAGVLDNGLLIDMTHERFVTVMTAKALGAWHLHTLTSHQELDFFVLFSSLASLIGSAGQGNYAAANAFMEGLAAYRVGIGLPALSIGWGPWAQIGMAADAHNHARLEAAGMGMLPPGSALDLLESLMSSRQGVIGAIAMSWGLWRKAFPLISTVFVSDLMPQQEASGALPQGRITADVLGKMPAERQVEELSLAIHRAVCGTLRLTPEQLSLDVPLSAIGLDSIVALELKNRIEANIDVVIRTPTLLKGPTIRELASHILPQMQTAASREVDAPSSQMNRASAGRIDSERVTDLLKGLGELSDNEVKEMLLELATAKEKAESARASET